MMDQENGLPEGWILLPVKSLGKIITGNTPPTKELDNYGGDIPFIKPSELLDRSVAIGRETISDKGAEKARIMPKGGVLVSCIGNLGKTAIAKRDVAFNQQINAIVFNESVIPEYGFYYFQTANFRKDLESLASATTISIVNKSKFESIEVPVASPEQQKCIVAEIEKQFSRLDEAVAGLKRIQANLKRYRASVLKSAVEGKLTAEWRKQHSNTESAEQLLARILKERRAHWEQAELKKMQVAGKPPKNELWKQKYKEPVAPDASNLPALPEGWVWATPEQLASINNYSLAIGPFGSNLKVSDYCQEGVPLIFVKNIRSKSFDGEKTKYVTETKAYELTPHKVNPGDILITKMGEPPGDACLYPLTCPPAIITADCIKWKLVSILDNVFFFIYAINSQPLKLQIQKITKGVAQQKISLGRFKSLVIPLPSLQEQAKIVSEVERRLSIADEVEQQINTNLKRAERLRQAILKKAFSGRLVPQDPNDEPASVLLEKIKQAQLA